MNKERSCLLIYNPTSGKEKEGNIVDYYEYALKKNNYRVDVLGTSYPHHATKAVAEADNYDIVFSIGGDGTLNEVVRGNYQRKDKLTICPVPCGTCNDVASMLGYKHNYVNNLNMALNGEVRNIDILTINDTPFIYVAGVGKFMNIPYATKSSDKKKIGYSAYLKESIPEVISQLKQFKAQITLDKKKLETDAYSLMMFSNSNHIAGVNNFHRNVLLDDQRMEVLLCKAKNRREFISSFAKHLMGFNSNEITALKAKEVAIKLLDRPEHNWCIDGEEYISSSDEYTITVADQMNFLVPSTNTKKLFLRK